MSDGFAAFLREQGTDRDGIQQAVRYFVSEVTGDLPEARLRRELVAAVGDEAAVDAALRELATDPAALEAIGLAVLGWGWEDRSTADAVERSVRAAKEKLPVIETGFLAMVAMYAMYLAVTGGVKKREKVVTRLADGSFEERETTELYGAAGPLGTVARLLPGASAAKP
jgi:hypothetical protein